MLVFAMLLGSFYKEGSAECSVIGCSSPCYYGEDGSGDYECVTSATYGLCRTGHPSFWIMLISLLLIMDGIAVLLISLDIGSMDYYSLIYISVQVLGFTMFINGCACSFDSGSSAILLLIFGLIIFIGVGVYNLIVLYRGRGSLPFGGFGGQKIGRRDGIQHIIDMRQFPPQCYVRGVLRNGSEQRAVRKEMPAQSWEESGPLVELEAGKSYKVNFVLEVSSDDDLKSVIDDLAEEIRREARASHSELVELKEYYEVQNWKDSIMLMTGNSVPSSPAPQVAAATPSEHPILNAILCFFGIHIFDSVPAAATPTPAPVAAPTFSGPAKTITVKCIKHVARDAKFRVGIMQRDLGAKTIVEHGNAGGSELTQPLTSSL